MGHVWFQESGASCFAPRPSLARPISRCDARGGSQRLINHDCYNSVNDVFLSPPSRGWMASIKYMNLFEYFNRDVPPSRQGGGIRKTRSRFAKRYYLGRFVAPIRN